MTYGLDKAGFFTRAGRPFVPVGVNYWPGSCGVDMWQAWPADEIRRDLDLIRALGLNAMRFFLRWPDFHPAPDRLDDTMLGRLDTFMGWCAERDLAAMPTLFVGFMSGGMFWPAWKQTNLYGPELRAACRFYTAGVARTLAPHAAAILAVDQGNELNCVPDSRAAGPAAVAAWSDDFARVLRAELGDVLVMSGLDHQTVCGELGWRVDNQAGCDCLSVHGYPVSPWWPVPFDGLTDPFCQNLLPLCTRINRAFGPAMVQEFGTIATYGARQQDAYLRAMLDGTRAAGANGWLWWCLRDIHAAGHPYVKNGMDHVLGLVDDAGRVKPGLEYFIEFAASVRAGLSPRAETGALGLYWPRHPYAQEDPANPGNSARDVFRGLATADAALRARGHAPRMVRGDRAVPPAVRTLIVAGASLDQAEAAALDAWVRGGGHLVLDGLDYYTLGPALTALIGAVPVDYRRPIEARFAWAGREWMAALFRNGIRVELEARGAQVAARDQDGVPMLLTHRVSAGRVTTVVPMLHEAFLAGAAGRDAWYARWAESDTDRETPQ